MDRTGRLIRLFANRQRFTAFAATCVTTLVLLGCGGGNGSGGGPAPADGVDNSIHHQRGIVTPPAGFTMSLASLKVIAPNAGPVGADGSFAFDNYGNRPNLITVTDATGKPVMLGLSDPASGKPTEVSAKMTALGLLFYAADAYTLPYTDQAAALGILSGNSALADLTNVVATRLAASPTALGDLDPAILSAVVQARTTMGGPPRAIGLSRRSQSTVASPPLGKQTGTWIAPFQVGQGSTRNDPGVQMQVIPASGHTTQSGLILQQSDNRAGLQITNTYRRPVLYYIQQTSYKDQNPDGSPGASHDLTKQIAEGAFPTDWLPSTHRLAGLLGGASDVILGNGSFQPVNSEPIPLVMNPANAAQSVYHVTVVGPGGGVGHPKLGADPYSAGSTKMTALGFFLDILIPALSNLMDLQFDLDKYLDETTLAGAETVFHLCLDLPEVADAYNQGEYKKMLSAVLSAISNNTIFRQTLLNKIRDAVLSAAAKSNNVAFWSHTLISASFLSKLNAVLWVVDKGVAFGDLGAITHDWGNSNWYEEWDVTTIVTKAQISPKDSTITKYSVQPLTATVGFEPNSSQGLSYKWSTTGNFGGLTDAKSHSGKSFETTENVVSYNPNLTGYGKDTVTVEIVLIDGNKKVSLGTAQTTVTVISTDSHAGTAQVTVTSVDASLADKFSPTSFTVSQINPIYWKPTTGRQIVSATFLDAAGHQFYLFLDSASASGVSQDFAVGETFNGGIGADSANVYILGNVGGQSYPGHFTSLGQNVNTTVTAFDGNTLSVNVLGHLRYEEGAANGSQDGIQVSINATVQLP